MLPLSPAQDYKRIGDGDAGPNTGGMGAYSPLPWLPTGGERRSSTRSSTRSRCRRCARSPPSSTPFIGLLYCGPHRHRRRGIRVIEFNARFGDPETQVVLPRLATPLSGLLFAAATGGLGELPAPEFSDDAAVTVVLASEGYPEAPDTGRADHGLDAAAVPECTSRTPRPRSAASGDGADAASPPAAACSASSRRRRTSRRRADGLRGAGHIRLEGGQYRTDIAARVAE